MHLFYFTIVDIIIKTNLMKMNFPTMLRVSTIVATIGLFSVAMTGCKKEEEDQAAKFNGSWTGTVACGSGGSGSGTMVFTATDKKTVTTTYSVGSAGCVKAMTLSGTANGNTLTFPATTVSDNCGLSYSLSGVGTISGNTMIFTFSANGAVNDQCTFTLTK
jgi:hypothetical protein